jgi:hypothetical protein
MAEVATGSAHAMAVWFGPSEDFNGPHQDFTRDEVLQDVASCSAWGATEDGKTMIVHGAEGRTMIEFDEPMERLVTFTHNPKGTWGLKRFWMNLSSVEPLIERIKSHVLYADTRGDFTELWINEIR